MNRPALFLSPLNLALVFLAAEGDGLAAAAQADPSAEISGEFPFQSKSVEVLGSRMHYIDEGEGPRFSSSTGTRPRRTSGATSSPS